MGRPGQVRALYDLKWTRASPASARIRIDVLQRDHTEQAVRAPPGPTPRLRTCAAETRP